jgi:hypothetical protein
MFSRADSLALTKLPPLIPSRNHGKDLLINPVPHQPMSRRATPGSNEENRVYHGGCRCATRRRRSAASYMESWTQPLPCRKTWRGSRPPERARSQGRVLREQALHACSTRAPPPPPSCVPRRCLVSSSARTRYQ